MKLRVYTPEETDELIRNIKLICKFIVDINKDALSIFDKKYQEYINAFKPGLIFKRKPLSRNDFISKCFYNTCTKTSMYEINDPYKSFSHIFFKDNFTENFEYCLFTPKLIYFDNHFIKYGINEWTVEDTKKFNMASESTYYFFRSYTFRDWYTILVKYAHKPFQFEKDDIKFLELVESELVRAKNYYENKNDL